MFVFSPQIPVAHAAPILWVAKTDSLESEFSHDLGHLHPLLMKYASIPRSDKKARLNHQ